MARNKREIYEIDDHQIKNNIGDITANYTKYTFASRLNGLLIEQQISQEELANKTNITMSSLSTYRNGKAEPKITALEKIASCLKVSIDYLLGLTDAKSVDVDIKSAHEYTQLSESALSHLHDFSNREISKKNIDLDLNILSYLIENGHIQNIIGLLRKSLVSSYEFGLIYGSISEHSTRQLIVSSNEFEFNKLMIDLYREAHIKLGPAFVSQIQQITVENIDEIKNTAKITRRKMDEILQNLEVKNQSVNEQEVQAAYVWKLIKLHEGGQK